MYIYINENYRTFLWEILLLALIISLVGMITVVEAKYCTYVCV